MCRDFNAPSVLGICFWSKVNIEMLTERDHGIIFRLTTGCSRESVGDLETENMSTSGELEPPTFRFMLNALTTWAFRARHLLSHVFEYRIWWYNHFWSEFNIWDFNYARVTSFIFDSRTNVLEKVWKIWRHNGEVIVSRFNCYRYKMV